MLSVDVRLPDDRLVLGVVWVAGGPFTETPPDLEPRLDARAEGLRAGLSPSEEARRKAVRDLLRQPHYKPTGRGKPASEYLLRSMQRTEEGRHFFPRITPLVDAANLFSAETLLPVSLWDLDRAGTDRYVVRLGAPGERYAFNATGQAIDLRDLLLGAAVPLGAPPTDTGQPCVNPVKDAQATKTTPATRRVGALIYGPAAVVSPDQMAHHVGALATAIGRCRGAPHGAEGEVGGRVVTTVTQSTNGVHR